MGKNTKKNEDLKLSPFDKYSTEKENNRYEEKIEESHAEVETTGPETINGTVVNAIHVNIRTTPDPDSEVIRLAEAGEKVKIVGKKNGFYEVETGVGRTGFILSDFIKEE